MRLKMGQCRTRTVFLSQNYRQESRTRRLRFVRRAEENKEVDVMVICEHRGFILWRCSKGLNAVKAQISV